MSAFDVQHRDCYESLTAMREAGGADLILTSPPYPDARKPEAYGAEFDTSFAGYQRLGDAVFQALKPGGVCALNIDGPIRQWRDVVAGTEQKDEPTGKDASQSERSLIAFKVAIDWAERVGFRYVEHGWYGRWGSPIGDRPPYDDGTGAAPLPRWRSGGEPLMALARPGAPVYLDRWASTRPAETRGRMQRNSFAPRPNGHRNTASSPLMATYRSDRRALTTCERHHCTDRTSGHLAQFSDTLADDYVLCYCPPSGLVGDPFVGSGTVAFSCHRHGRRFIGGDLGIRKETTVHGRKVPCGRRWADIVNDGLRQTRLFA